MDTANFFLKKMERKTTSLLLALSLAFLAFVVWSSRQKVSAPVEVPKGMTTVSNFEECAKAGYPVMTTYPAQCTANGQVFEETYPDAEPPMNGGVTNFEECVAAGFPVGESYPRQCFADGRNFTEIIDSGSLSPLSEAEALDIAREACPAEVEAWGPGSYNENSGTWWFDVQLKESKAGCNPACVVTAETRSVEVNWRCTGLIRPGEGSVAPSEGGTGR